MTRDSSPKKLFRIGEVSQLTGVNPHILRYWEAEFQILAPNRRLSKQRLYRQADLDLILTIKRLLGEEKYTLSGVKQYLAEHFATSEAASLPGPPDTLPSPGHQPDPLITLLRQELQDILAIMDVNKPDE